MARDQWRGQEEGAEDCLLTERDEVDPLAQLAVDLVLAYEAVEHDIGAFCSACTCQLGYHITGYDLSCDTCGCDELSWYCACCGKSRSMDCFPMGVAECKFCMHIPPVKIPSRLAARLEATN